MSKPDPISLCHWGAFAAEVINGQLISARPWKGSGADSDMIGASPALVYSEKRIDQPYVREGWLRDRDKSDGTMLGHDRMDLSRNCAAPLTAFYAQKEKRQ